MEQATTRGTVWWNRPGLLAAAITAIFVLILGVAVALDGSGSKGMSAQRQDLQSAPRGETRRPTAPSTPGAHVAAVVSTHELATDAGMEVLDNGGTAADAAVAVAASLSVVEPWFSSALGGGTWALYYDAETGEVSSLDGVGPTGSKATVADYRPQSGSSGMHQAVVPGAWDGWMLWLDRFGTLDLPEVLAPAIRQAREGYPVSGEMVSRELGREWGTTGFDSSRRIRSPGSRRRPTTWSSSASGSPTYRWTGSSSSGLWSAPASSRAVACSSSTTTPARRRN